ncbi:inovirus-type Gp2 protein [Halodesulfovibrio sp.]|uniref:YagK/YfjJ domain-containing protein n=1 Tax=Halodesulfovibrio sp. TaxID=1912772 RepID=UPI0025BBDB04|nr:inovirus-type Gp2 protein [Halodesulfovibrio sp.]
MKNKNVIYDSTYKGHPINTNAEKHQGCYEDILQNTKGILDTQIAKHNKVHVARFDLRFPAEYSAHSDNDAISKCKDTFTRKLKRNGSDPKMLWVREQSREKHQHYHCFVAVDGNKHQAPQKLHAEVEKHWNRALDIDENTQGLVHHCNRDRKGDSVQNSYNLRRNDDNFQEEYDKCLMHFSYLAKVNTKGYEPKGKHMFGCSQWKHVPIG